MKNLLILALKKCLKIVFKFLTSINYKHCKTITYIIIFIYIKALMVKSEYNNPFVEKFLKFDFKFQNKESRLF